jgi:uncharacterized membrane protein YfcA
MTSLIIAGFFILSVAVAMTMVGKGGGNFYVVILAIAGVSMHEAATTGQFILFSASVAAMIVFQKNKSVSWPLAFFVGSVTAISALGGGYFSHVFSGFSLKLIFAVMLLIAGAVMIVPVSERQVTSEDKHFGVIRIRNGQEVYGINLWIALPVTVLTGFGSGMVGVSGGSFLVPLMVLACKVPMHTAVATASTLIAATAFMGFAGHAFQGDFNPSWAVPLAIVTIVGGILGGKLALRSKPKHLKTLFAYTNWLAALFMIVNAFHTKGIL